MPMLAVILCLLGVLAILVVNEFFWRHKILKGESRRKFVHIAATAFIAFWPWLISWRTIQVLGIAMLVVLLLNRQFGILNYLGGLRKDSYGDIFLALAVILCASLTDEKIFFAVALLHVALADGLAAIVGAKFGQRWHYKIFNQTKTILGSMTFWVVSIFILGIGLLPAYYLIPFSNYALLLLLLPPTLTALENIGFQGSDNLTIPIAVITALQIAQAS